jgi:hypothetical protein
MIEPSRMALLRIRYEATSPGLVPAEVTIALDGAPVHSGPTEEAFEHVAHVAPGRHTIVPVQAHQHAAFQGAFSGSAPASEWSGAYFRT